MRIFRSGALIFQSTLKTTCVFLCVLVVMEANAQPKRPLFDGRIGVRALLSYVTKVQDLSFGAFCTRGSGGTVTVSSSGSRSATGDIVLLTSGFYAPAVFHFDANSTNVVSITVENIVNLTNGAGGSLTLQINDFYPASPFTPVVGENTLNVGGTLTVGDQRNTPAGEYSGSFEIMFNQE
jgi:hypothetical protein